MGKNLQDIFKSWAAFHFNQTMTYSNLIVPAPDFPKKGITFFDLSPLFANPVAVQQLIDDLKKSITIKPTKVVTLESRGFVIGSPLALQLQSSFVMCRKPGKLPGEVVSSTFNLEYKQGEGFEIQKAMLNENDIVLIHDDILATGGSAEAAANLCIKCGVKKENIQFCFIADIPRLNGGDKLKDYKWTCAIHLQ